MRVGAEVGVRLRVRVRMISLLQVVGGLVGTTEMAANNLTTESITIKATNKL